ADAYKMIKLANTIDTVSKLDAMMHRNVWQPQPLSCCIGDMQKPTQLLSWVKMSPAGKCTSMERPITYAMRKVLASRCTGEVAETLLTPVWYRETL
ncbi:MAG: hypothetical protein P4L81_02425, partial [Candidatus Pacebacteria bacterium]|nr:hypothetical protein [Candidatus Paceibacterota bacterium]